MCRCGVRGLFDGDYVRGIKGRGDKEGGYGRWIRLTFTADALPELGGKLLLLVHCLLEVDMYVEAASLVVGNWGCEGAVGGTLLLCWRVDVGFAVWCFLAVWVVSENRRYCEKQSSGSCGLVFIGA